MDFVTIGLDVGQQHDPTAIVVAEAIEQATGRYRRVVERGGPSMADYLTGRAVPGIAYELGPVQVHMRPILETRFLIRFLERLTLGTPYPQVAKRVAAVVQALRDQRPEASLQLTVDVTGVGRPVFEIIEQSLDRLDITLTAATFTYGDRLAGHLGDRAISVGKAFLVSRLQALLQTDRIKLPTTPEALALGKELQDYEIKIDTDANEKYGAFQVGTHDDLVTALGLAVLEDPQFTTLEW